MNENISEEVVEEEPPIKRLYDKNAEFDGNPIKWIRSNMKYPPICEEYGLQGRVFVRFAIEEDGSVNEVEVLRGINEWFDEEAVRLVCEMPNWKAAEKDGKKVRSEVVFPIEFRLDWK